MSDDASMLLGSWLLRRFQIEDLATGERNDAYGLDPRGMAIFMPNGRMAAMITPRHQPVPASEADRAAAFASMIAYSGRYRLEPPDRFVTTVDVSWLALWTDTDQGRTYRLDGDKLEIISAPGPSPHGGGAMVRGILSWVREA